MTEAESDRSTVLKQLRASFESQLRTNGATSIETWLNAVPPEERRRLFEELLLTEIRFLREKGKPSRPADYLVRFPEQQSVIESVFKLYDVGQLLDSQPANRVQESTITLVAFADPEVRDPAPGDFLGRYKLEVIVGCGSFGDVWKAFDPDLGRYVAIKVPRKKIQRRSDLLQHFREEAKRAASLNQAGIVPVYDIGMLGAGAYIVTELIEGPTLGQRISLGKIPREESVRIVIQLARSLHEAHRAGLVHRDIKPSNVLLRPDGTPAISDFGLAITEEEQLTTPDGIVGTVAYMSPEQARGEASRVDGRSDLYSLGVILFQLLTGRLPFQYKTSKDLLEQIIHREVRPLRTIDDNIPPDLERICLKCLAKNVKDRYTTGLDLAADLEHVSSPRRTQSNRSWIGKLALVACVLGGVVFLIFGMDRKGAADAPRKELQPVVGLKNQWLNMLNQPLDQITNIKSGSTDFVHHDEAAPSLTFQSNSNIWLLATPHLGNPPLHLRGTAFLDGWIGQAGFMWGLDMGKGAFPPQPPRCFAVVVERHQPDQPLLLKLKELKVGPFVEGIQWVNNQSLLASTPISMPEGPSINMEIKVRPDGIEVILDGNSIWNPRASDDPTNRAMLNAAGRIGFVGKGKTVVFRDAAAMFETSK